ncbi:hypothetical protein JQU17_06055 [Ponticoccus sp. SC2-23]|uniref:hypothetical protein n=1 Tax=Alexandriicola marinus TaxID=2081710 RepID=UPI000FD8EECC|nr:hypothetical protein [Alexandriicola marinus]MBM1219753.1 hypothetical protein [Ponticoccus sp. SC6-9]MBM1223175.1 hypothetical protein [Ponticoccus sp. SC6-15]MBM1229566.1 hypothetical protein [Ponticoccus sp. SC6-38]MBM1232141.1 hypothetical protein [Ponticoccus sp. SC6-45]MBM1237909.1 hypothetical protein [Ponticoccus sp. SC6-49]MBM1241152.1 hypothetical protein [Ponticoccus sp. SC2-64]MBM1245665.1 hypothetical protein [Ponticoccus sp. SC6-42]MBM1250143.1 hypothetical protein [Pontico
MKMTLIIAALINLAVAVVHTFIGEASIVAPLMTSDAPDLVKATLHSAWHMISVVLYLSSLTLFYLSRKEVRDPTVKLLSGYIGIQYVALAMVFAVTSVIYGQFFPQIVMLLPIGVLSLWAAHMARKS